MRAAVCLSGVADLRHGRVSGLFPHIPASTPIHTVVLPGGRTLKVVGARDPDGKRQLRQAAGLRDEVPGDNSCSFFAGRKSAAAIGLGCLMLWTAVAPPRAAAASLLLQPVAEHAPWQHAADSAATTLAPALDIAVPALDAAADSLAAVLHTLVVGAADNVVGAGNGLAHMLLGAGNVVGAGFAGAGELAGKAVAAGAAVIGHLVHVLLPTEFAVLVVATALLAAPALLALRNLAIIQAGAPAPLEAIATTAAAIAAPSATAGVGPGAGAATPLATHPAQQQQQQLGADLQARPADAATALDNGTVHAASSAASLIPVSSRDDLAMQAAGLTSGGTRVNARAVSGGSIGGGIGGPGHGGRSAPPGGVPAASGAGSSNGAGPTAPAPSAGPTPPVPAQQRKGMHDARSFARLSSARVLQDRKQQQGQQQQQPPGGRQQQQARAAAASSPAAQQPPSSGVAPLQVNRTIAELMAEQEAADAWAMGDGGDTSVGSEGYGVAPLHRSKTIGQMMAEAANEEVVASYDGDAPPQPPGFLQELLGFQYAAEAAQQGGGLTGVAAGGGMQPADGRQQQLGSSGVASGYAALGQQQAADVPVSGSAAEERAMALAATQPAQLQRPAAVAAAVVVPGQRQQQQQADTWPSTWPSAPDSWASGKDAGVQAGDPRTAWVVGNRRQRGNPVSRALGRLVGSVASSLSSVAGAAPKGRGPDGRQRLSVAQAVCAAAAAAQSAAQREGGLPMNQRLLGSTTAGPLLTQVPVRPPTALRAAAPGGAAAFFQRGGLPPHQSDGAAAVAVAAAEARPHPFGLGMQRRPLAPFPAGGGATPTAAAVAANGGASSRGLQATQTYRRVLPPLEQPWGAAVAVADDPRAWPSAAQPAAPLPLPPQPPSYQRRPPSPPPQPSSYQRQPPPSLPFAQQQQYAAGTHMASGPGADEEVDDMDLPFTQRPPPGPLDVTRWLRWKASQVEGNPQPFRRVPRDNGGGAER